MFERFKNVMGVCAALLASLGGVMLVGPTLRTVGKGIAGKVENKFFSAKVDAE